MVTPARADQDRVLPHHATTATEPAVVAASRRGAAARPPPTRERPHHDGQRPAATTAFVRPHLEMQLRPGAHAHRSVAGILACLLGRGFSGQVLGSARSLRSLVRRLRTVVRKLLALSEEERRWTRSSLRMPRRSSRSGSSATPTCTFAWRSTASGRRLGNKKSVP